MAPIDYSRIASAYDLAEFRSVSAADYELVRLAEAYDRVKALDLACGTGSYIEAQRRRLPNVILVGLDASSAMIGLARRKGLQNLVLADVDKGLPLRESTFDYVTCRFAFHHFVSKPVVVAEVRRCLRDGGVFNIVNVDPHSNVAWWVYVVFPEVISADRARFWTRENFGEHLTSCGFKVEVKVSVEREVMSKAAILGRLKLRDTSQLHLVDDELFARRLRQVQEWPDDRKLVGDAAFITVTAVKRGLKEASV